MEEGRNTITCMKDNKKKMNIIMMMMVMKEEAVHQFKK